jgi:hypothetical protein
MHNKNIKFIVVSLSCAFSMALRRALAAEAHGKGCGAPMPASHCAHRPSTGGWQVGSRLCREPAPEAHDKGCGAPMPASHCAHRPSAGGWQVGGRLCRAPAPEAHDKGCGPPCQPAIVRIDLRPVAGRWGLSLPCASFPGTRQRPRRAGGVSSLPCTSFPGARQRPRQG